VLLADWYRLGDWERTPPRSVPREVWDRFAAARRRYFEALFAAATESIRLQQGSGWTRDVRAARRKESKERVHYERASKEVAVHAPRAGRRFAGAGLRASEVANRLRADEALVEIYPLIGKTVAFVVRRSGALETVDIGPGYRDADLFEQPIGQWLPKYEDVRRKSVVSPDGILALRTALNAAIMWLSSTYDFAALCDQLTGMESVTFVLHYPFYFLPLHAAALPDGRRVLDLFDVRVLPTVNYRRRAHTLAAEGWRFGAVSNPRPQAPYQLSYSACQTAAAGSFFARRTIYAEAAATRENVLALLRSSDVMHFSCHARHFYLYGSYLHSHLLLAGDDTLSIPDAYRWFGSRAPKVVVLAACDSGAGDPAAFSDEGIDSPTAFLRAGCKTVISALWQVEERATTLLMYTFYRNMVTEQKPPAAALRAAQRWLRSATGRELVETAREILELSPGAAPPGFVAWMERYGSGRLADRTPYEDPFYWAAFQTVGH
jgi:hypothetical protein